MILIQCYYLVSTYLIETTKKFRNPTVTKLLLLGQVHMYSLLKSSLRLIQILEFKKKHFKNTFNQWCGLQNYTMGSENRVPEYRIYLNTERLVVEFLDYFSSFQSPDLLDLVCKHDQILPTLAIIQFEIRETSVWYTDDIQNQNYLATEQLFIS